MISMNNGQLPYYLATAEQVLKICEPEYSQLDISHQFKAVLSFLLFINCVKY
jgi:hypothetical protein